ncbi:hypothetical protein L1987_42508 [Smallanthus sonchifolius]|uniref:Uncharacterized protein n=1 Tax=Smallanthus sonchifolius TaxID=185202 RepID=A0ACB9GJP4_9ASTR|nr:hypothetical protein L1987_42508 [Smallanthus sonchifolius]
MRPPLVSFSGLDRKGLNPVMLLRFPSRLLHGVLPERVRRSNQIPPRKLPSDLLETIPSAASAKRYAAEGQLCLHGGSPRPFRAQRHADLGRGIGC